MELEANDKTSLVKLLAINNFASDRRSFLDRSHLDLIHPASAIGSRP